MLRRFLALLAFALILLPGTPLLAEDSYSTPIRRAYEVLNKGQEVRARGLFKKILEREPKNRWALEGYEAAGGDLATLGLSLKPAEEEKKAEAGSLSVEYKAEAKATAVPEVVETLEAGAELKPVEHAEEPAPKGPSLGERVMALMRRMGYASLLAVAAVLGLALLIAIGYGLMRFARWHEARWHAKVDAMAASRESESLYVEYHYWTAFWGYFIKREKETNQFLEKFSAEGWACQQVITGVHMPDVARIIFISLLSLGFLRYNLGPTFLFHRKAA